MSFYEALRAYDDFDFKGFLTSRTDAHVKESLGRERLTPLDFLTLLSEAANPHLEAMAGLARRRTIQQFGRTMGLFIPLYIANHCTNECLYCGFNRSNRIGRRKLSLAEIEAEARAIAQSGMRHLLVLTGEAPAKTPISYLEKAVTVLKKYFASIHIEIFPLDRPDYVRLKDAGVDGLTLYQEAYDEKVYRSVHLSGRKRDYRYRLDGPERGAAAGFRTVSIGALLGLADPVKESFFTGLHARYLEDRYPACEVGAAMPRINPAEGGFQPPFPVSDRTFVRILAAYRLFLPRANIAISTRETAAFRDRLLHLGATRFSAGSRTEVGGYAGGKAETPGQFDISDARSIPDVVAAIEAGGYQPVYKDWEMF